MYTVGQLLQIKGNTVWSIGPETTVYEALQLMADKNLGAALVLKEGKVAGIFSERDYARKVILKGKSSKTTLVSDLMTTEVLYVHPNDTIENCMALMTTKRARHLPVLENGQLIGIISIGDVVREVISHHEFTIHELESYIGGGQPAQFCALGEDEPATAGRRAEIKGQFIPARKSNGTEDRVCRETACAADDRSNFFCGGCHRKPPAC